MPGAGSATLIGQHEDAYASSLVAGDPFEMGRDPSITELDLNQQLERMRNADSVWDVEAVAQNVEGAVGIEAIVSADVHAEVEQIAFNSGGTSIDGTSLANSARILVGVDWATGSADRELQGCIPGEYRISYDQGENVTYSLTMFYADETPSANIDTTTVTEVTDGSSVPFWNFDLQLDGGSIAVDDLQSAELAISDIARPQYGASRTANRGVIDAPSASLDVEAILRSADRLDFARGNSTGTLPDNVDSVPGTITLTAADGTAVSTYNLAAVHPGEGYSWNRVIDTEDTTDQISAAVVGDNAVNIT